MHHSYQIWKIFLEYFEQFLKPLKNEINGNRVSLFRNTESQYESSGLLQSLPYVTIPLYILASLCYNKRKLCTGPLWHNATHPNALIQSAYQISTSSIPSGPININATIGLILRPNYQEFPSHYLYWGFGGCLERTLSTPRPTNPAE